MEEKIQGGTGILNYGWLVVARLLWRLISLAESRVSESVTTVVALTKGSTRDLS